MTLSVTKVSRFNRRTKFVEAAAECLRVAYNLRRVVATKLFHLAYGNEQCGQGVEVMVAGRAGEDSAVSSGPVFFLSLGIQVAQNHTALWSRKGLMGTTGHPHCPLV